MALYFLSKCHESSREGFQVDNDFREEVYALNVSTLQEMLDARGTDRLKREERKLVRALVAHDLKLDEIRGKQGDTKWLERRKTQIERQMEKTNDQDITRLKEIELSLVDELLTGPDVTISPIEKPDVTISPIEKPDGYNPEPEPEDHGNVVAYMMQAPEMILPQYVSTADAHGKNIFKGIHLQGVSPILAQLGGMFDCISLSEAQTKQQALEDAAACYNKINMSSVAGGINHINRQVRTNMQDMPEEVQLPPWTDIELDRLNVTPEDLELSFDSMMSSSGVSVENEMSDQMEKKRANLPRFGGKFGVSR